MTKALAHARPPARTPSPRKIASRIAAASAEDLLKLVNRRPGQCRSLVYRGRQGLRDAAPSGADCSWASGALGPDQLDDARRVRALARPPRRRSRASSGEPASPRSIRRRFEQDTSKGDFYVAMIGKARQDRHQRSSPNSCPASCANFPWPEIDALGAKLGRGRQPVLGPPRCIPSLRIRSGDRGDGNRSLRDRRPRIRDVTAAIGSWRPEPFS